MCVCGFNCFKTFSHNLDSGDSVHDTPRASKYSKEKSKKIVVHKMKKEWFCVQVRGFEIVSVFAIIFATGAALENKMQETVKEKIKAFRLEYSLTQMKFRLTKSISCSVRSTIINLYFICLLYSTCVYTWF